MSDREQTQSSPGQELIPALVGGTLGILFSGLLSFVPSHLRTSILALLLAAIGAVYVGSALAQSKGLLVETIIALACALLALGGLEGSPILLAVGYQLHGFWDLFHHAKTGTGTVSQAQRWYPPFCAVFDWVVAISIALLYLPVSYA